MKVLYGEARGITVGEKYGDGTADSKCTLDGMFRYTQLHYNLHLPGPGGGHKTQPAA